MHRSLACVLTALLCAPLAAQDERTRQSGYDNDPGFAGPGSTVAQLEEDDEVKAPAFRFAAFDEAFSPWFEWKAGLQEDIGLQFGLAYTSLYQTADDTLPGSDDNASSGLARLFGKWSLINRGGPNEGALVFNVDHRHRYDDLAPADLGFAAGYLGIPGALFNDNGALLGDLYWSQLFNDGNTGVIIGRYDPNDFFDVSGHANPFTSFQNLSILFNASIALPDFSTGIGAGHWFNDSWYIKAAVNDVNGTATDIKLFDDFDELYTTAEFGWSPTREERYFKNVRITAWHADERDADGVEDSEGIAIGANWTWDQQFMLFAKAGWSDGTAPLYNESVTAGALYYVPERSDLIGLAFNWSDPAIDGLRDQYTGELFYRLQLAQNLAITPSAQVWIDPSNNLEEDTIFAFGLRMRVTF